MLLEDRTRLASVLLCSLILILSLMAVTKSGEQEEAGEQQEEEEEGTRPTCLLPPVCPNSSDPCNFEVESRILRSNYHFYGPEIRDISRENLQHYTCNQTTVSAWDECEGSMAFGIQKLSLPAVDYEEEEEPVEAKVQPVFILADWVVANVCLNALAQVVPEDCVTQVGIVELVKQDRALFVYAHSEVHDKVFEYASDANLRISNLSYVINPGSSDEVQLPHLQGLPFVNVTTAHALFNTSTAGSPGRMTLLAHMPEYLKLSCKYKQTRNWTLFRAEFVLEKYIMIVPISNCRHPHAITGEIIQLLSFTVLGVNCSSGKPVLTTSKTFHTNKTVSEEEKSTYQNLISEMASNGWSNYIRTPVNHNPHSAVWLNTTICTLNPFPDEAHHPPCDVTQRDNERGQVRDEL